MNFTDNPLPPSSIFVAFRGGELNGLELKFVEHMEAWLKAQFAASGANGAEAGAPPDVQPSDKVIGLTRRAP